MKKALYVLFSAIVIALFGAIVLSFIYISSYVSLATFVSIVKPYSEDAYVLPRITEDNGLMISQVGERTIFPLSGFKGELHGNDFSAPSGMGYVIVKEKPKDVGIATLTISAAGDCTLGSDSGASGYGSFIAEVMAKGKDYSHFLKLVKPYFAEDDLTIVNFEGTLSNSGARRDKEYAFRGEPEYVNILTSASVEAVNLANNHTYDYGASAFSDTKRIMEENEVIWFEGSDIKVTKVNGIKVGLIGTNLLKYEGQRNFIKNMTALKALEPDLIIASFHWGTERMYVPTDIQKQFAHLAIDNGADLVLGHHPHVLQPIERYNGKYIVYSLGNFCFGGNKNPVDKDSMIFIQTFCFENGSLLPEENVFIVPCSVSSEPYRNNYQPMPLAGENFERVKKKIINISAGYEGIENITFLEGTEEAEPVLE